MPTVCLRCNVATSVGDQNGEMGLPSLDERPRGRGRHPVAARLAPDADLESETFGYLYSGLRAVGLITHALETYREFLKKHGGKGHRLFWWSQEADNLPETQTEPRFQAYTHPKRAPGFVWARARFSCAKCEDSFNSTRAEWVRPFKPRSLSPDDIAELTRRTLKPSEENIRDAWPFEILLFDHLPRWLKTHARHGVTLELVQQVARKKPAPVRPAKAPLPWVPPKVPPGDDERLPAPVSDDVLPVLSGFYHHEPSMRARAAREVGARGERGAIYYLAHLLDDPAEEVRVAATRAIGALGGPQSVWPLGQALLDESEEVRAAARAALKHAGIQEDLAVAKARAPRGLLDSAAVQAAVAASAKNDRTRVARLAVDTHSHSRSEAARELRQPGVRHAMTTVVALLNDYHDSVVGSAARAAEALAVPELVEPLVAAAARASEDTGYAIVEALGTIGDPRALPTIVRALHDEKNSNARSAGFAALVKIQHPAALQTAIDLSGAKDRDIRWWAASTLAHWKSPDAVAALVDLLKDEEPTVRYAAASSLILLGERAGLRALHAAAVRGDAEVARAGAEFLIAEGDSATEGALLRALETGSDDRARLATLFRDSGNKTLAAAGRAFLRYQKPAKGVRPIAWGEGRRA